MTVATETIREALERIANSRHCKFSAWISPADVACEACAQIASAALAALGRVEERERALTEAALALKQHNGLGTGEAGYGAAVKRLIAVSLSPAAGSGEE